MKTLDQSRLSLFSDSFEEVIQNIRNDWYRRGITVDTACKMLGYKTRQTIYNINTAKRYLLPEQALRYATVFGYDYDYLTTGVGMLFADSATNPNYDTDMHYTLRSIALIRIADYLFKAIKDDNANNAWLAIKKGDYKSFCNFFVKIDKKAGTVLETELSSAARIASKDEYIKAIEDNTFSLLLSVLLNPASNSAKQEPNQ